MNIRTDILTRAYLSFGFIVLFAVTIMVKLFHVQYVEGDEWRSMADSLSTRYLDVEAVRGNIFSNDGSLLATSIPEYDLRADLLASGIEDDDVFYAKVDSLAGKLSSLFGDKSSSQYASELKQARKKGNRYYLIKRNVGHQNLKLVKGFPIFNMGKYKGGLIAERKNKRILPFKNLAARTIGYKIPAEGVNVGLEGAYGSFIDGTNGKRLVQRIAGGVWMPVNRDEEIVPVDGSDIISTIDVNLQDMAQRALEKQLIQSNADNGCVILMEVKTGEIRAVANFTKDQDGVYREKFNYAIAQSAEPGSTFKLASYMVALEEGILDTNTMIETGNGTFQVHRHTIRDTHTYGTITAKEAFELSSNAAIVKVIYNHYKDKPAAFIKKLHEMHLNDSLGLQIPGEVNPWIKTPDSKSWSGLSLPQIAYGYELKITPLQMLTLFNAVANNGKMVAPLFVKEIRHLGNTVERFQAKVIDENIASAKTVRKVQSMMEGVMETGTGKRMQSPLFRSAGKTGTAQMADGASGYAKRRYQSSFAGYFPAENPKYSIIVVIQNPRNGYYGSTIAGPVFRELAEMVYANDLDMHKNFGEVKLADAKSKLEERKNISASVAHRNANKAGLLSGWFPEPEDEQKNPVKEDAIPASRLKEGRVPRVLGLGLKDAVFALESSGFLVEIKGKGRVVKQSLESGKVYERGSVISLILE